MSGRSGTGEHGRRDQPNGSQELEGRFNAADECWPAHVNQSTQGRLAGLALSASRPCFARCHRELITFG